jgi:hypothetical protein
VVVTHAYDYTAQGDNRPFPEFSGRAVRIGAVCSGSILRRSQNLYPLIYLLVDASPPGLAIPSKAPDGRRMEMLLEDKNAITGVSSTLPVGRSPAR